ncbi:hypothetical protein AAFF_G00399800 [Aldrovandia affinis]|uniref:Uncharacterized protein n=1 Tax=Aldrovandia affinis TaxID=143900 RepID=A0AAD7WKE7_9TELE|nr:hypothetical protein AAFF_G00399800 [Aldrovandia affinis]
MHIEARCNHHTMAVSTSWSRAVKPSSSTLGVNLTTSPWTVSSPPTKSWDTPWGLPCPSPRPPTAKPPTQLGSPAVGSTPSLLLPRIPGTSLDVRSGFLAGLKCRFL